MNIQSNLQTIHQKTESKATLHKIRICLGSSCFSKAKETNLEYIERFLKVNKVTDKVDFAGHLCIDQCITGPNIEIDDIMYSEVDPAKLEKILRFHFGL